MTGSSSVTSTQRVQSTAGAGDGDGDAVGDGDGVGVGEPGVSTHKYNAPDALPGT